MAKTGWNRKLGSKRSQGIVTPKAPRGKVCGCLFHGSELFQLCYRHRTAFSQNMQQILEQFTAMAKQKSEEKKESTVVEELEKQTKEDTPKSTPQVENTETTENVSVKLS